MSNDFGLTGLLPMNYAQELHTTLISLYDERYWAILNAVYHTIKEYELKLNKMLQIEMERKKINANDISIIQTHFQKTIPAYENIGKELVYYKNIKSISTPLIKLLNSQHNNIPPANCKKEKNQKVFPYSSGKNGDLRSSDMIYSMQSNKKDMLTFNIRTNISKNHNFHKQTVLPVVGALGKVNRVLRINWSPNKKFYYQQYYQRYECIGKQKKMQQLRKKYQDGLYYLNQQQNEIRQAYEQHEQCLYSQQTLYQRQQKPIGVNKNNNIYHRRTVIPIIGTLGNLADNFLNTIGLDVSGGLSLNNHYWNMNTQLNYQQYNQRHKCIDTLMRVQQLRKEYQHRLYHLNQQQNNIKKAYKQHERCLHNQPTVFQLQTDGNNFGANQHIMDYKNQMQLTNI